MDLKEKKVVIVGLGETARAAAGLLKRLGAQPFVSESRALPGDDAGLQELEALSIPYETGGHTEQAFAGCHFVLPSPGVPATLPAIQHALHNGARILTELDAAWPSCRSKVIAVTGTNGKTTVTELLARIIQHCGHSVLLAGNNALPFSRAVTHTPAPEFMVLEVSSYALEHTRQFHPRAAAVLNLTPDHLERHGSMEAYAAAKARIFRNQTPNDIAVLNYDNEWTRKMSQGLMPEILWFSMERMVRHGLAYQDGDICEMGHPLARGSVVQLPGAHNMANVLAALTLARAAGFDWGSAVAAVEEFQGVEHRIERVPNDLGIDVYNDSKATNLESMRVALESFGDPVVLIAGGRGKGEDYGEVSELVAGRTRHVVLVGEEAPAMHDAWMDKASCEHAESLEDAVRKGIEAAKPAGTLLFSPGCASFDSFRNFEERGTAFKASVARMAGLFGEPH